MNLGLLMNVSSSGMPLKSSIPTVNNESEGFGRVFQGLMSAISVPAKQQIVGTNSELTTLVEDVLNTDSLEKLEGMVEALKQSVRSPVVAQLEKESKLLQTQLVNEATVKKMLSGIVEEEQLQNIPVLLNEDVEMKLTNIVNLQKFPSLQQLAHQISEEPDKLIETITNVLEDAGMTKEQFDQLAATGDIWFVLDVLQQLPTEKIKEAMGQLPPKSAVELIALLKAVELAAAKMDLFTKQVDLVKTIQPIFSQIASQLEQKIIQPEVKHSVQIPPTMQNFIRISTEQMSADTEQQNHQSKPSETVAPLSAVATTETRPVYQMNATEKVPESRSEALMREFQAILNRANFGQTNGMNRISVKLYPEHLGQIRIELLEINGVMTARILASTAMAREMLDSQMHQLRQAFNQQNLQVDRIDLSQTLQDPSKSDREQAFNKQNHQQKEQATEQNENPDEQEQTFQEFMIELEA
ncbi:flagellar hook-length control protein FliK [Sporosarcina sp. P7]|uniref:flagellar hook-length control protein FliK n=1 Tax=Sporosarcina sp. P7 TaxID=2048244 RepID=UPI000C172CC4|nr:flagellar hook-length control protein FliK [Sporosarcina sp. P7]PID25573.1 hypothetical protein CSV60_02980 [Sporosarcina sp. P7]